MKSLRAASLAVFLVAAACGGRAIDRTAGQEATAASGTSVGASRAAQGTNPGASAGLPETSGGNRTPIVVTADAAPPGAAASGSTSSPEPLSADNGSCQATCTTPAGTLETFGSLESIYRAMAGQWQICAGAANWAKVGAPSDTIGVEFDPVSPGGAGNMYYLVNSPTGPTPGSGFAYQLTYDVSPEGPGSYQLNMHPAPNSGFGGAFRYSPCPTEFQMTSLSYDDGSTLVRFGAGPLPITPTVDGSAETVGNAAPPMTCDGGAPESDAGCHANCCSTAGLVATFSSIADIYAAMEGRWQVCTDLASLFAAGAPSDTIGIEYGPASSMPTANGSTVGGDMYYLVAGPTGPVRGTGVEYQLTYDVSPEGPGSYQLNMHPTPNSGFGGAFRYSPCPTEFELSDQKAVLVPF